MGYYFVTLVLFFLINIYSHCTDVYTTLFIFNSKYMLYIDNECHFYLNFKQISLYSKAFIPSNIRPLGLRFLIPMNTNREFTYLPRRIFRLLCFIKSDISKIIENLKGITLSRRGYYSLSDLDNLER